MIEENMDFISYGIYTPHFDFDTSEKYKEEIREIREQIFNYRTSARPRALKSAMKDLKPMYPYLEQYSRLNYLVRCLVLQGWCWQPACRHENMIMDIMDHPAVQCNSLARGRGGQGGLRTSLAQASS